MCVINILTCCRILKIPICKVTGKVSVPVSFLRRKHDDRLCLGFPCFSYDGAFYVFLIVFHSMSRLTYSDLCIQIPESKFRQCLLATLAMLFKLLSSYYAIMSFQPDEKVCSLLSILYY